MLAFLDRYFAGLFYAGFWLTLVMETSGVVEDSQFSLFGLLFGVPVLLLYGWRMRASAELEASGGA